MGMVYDEIEVGDTVIIRHGMGSFHRVVTVEKVLKTQIVMEVDESRVGATVRFNKRTGREVGGEEDIYYKDCIALTRGSGRNPDRLMTVEDLEAMKARKVATSRKTAIIRAIKDANLRFVSLDDLETVAEFLGLEVK